ncbi:Cytochrome P450 monooxygenase CLM2 [Cladobotryum mycophilum]|uniref:Cytochrome P450 monooxygenase CLM2 n=1 Tax=Cladobotryum mycophilum TaxID=491253 RepID=A0ABR0SQM9_9HYPO
MQNLLVLGIICTTIWLIFRLRFRRKVVQRLPPGPKPLPILGNIFDMPPNGVPEFQHWLTHKDKYGPISSVSVMGQTIVILHDREAADNLLNKQSLKSSGRPSTVFASELCGFGGILALRQCDSGHRRQRKLIHQVLGTNEAVAQFGNLQRDEMQRFLWRTLEQPETLFQHLPRKTGAAILKMTYGYSVERNKPDPLVALIDGMINNMSLASVPLSWMVDVIPALRHLPDDFPGASFKETAKLWKKGVEEVIDTPYSFVRRRMAAGDHRPSFLNRLLEEYSGDGKESTLSPEEELNIKFAAANMYIGGTTTSADTLKGLILAMTMFPEVQRKGQEEIDRVIGTDRLPQFEDRDNLPYIESIVKETLRWLPIGPLAVPHKTSEEMEYNGYTIPSGAMIMPSIWWFLHDPAVYRDPSSFDPDRYLEPRNEPDPKPLAFGYGRRVCPGRYVADASIFILAAQMLSVFNIGRALDSYGREIRPELKVIPGIVASVVDFPYKITPRSEQKAELVRRIGSEMPQEESDAAFL